MYKSKQILTIMQSGLIRQQRDLWVRESITQILNWEPVTFSAKNGWVHTNRDAETMSRKSMRDLQNDSPLISVEHASEVEAHNFLPESTQTIPFCWRVHLSTANNICKKRCLLWSVIPKHCRPNSHKNLFHAVIFWTEHNAKSNHSTRAQMDYLIASSFSSIKIISWWVVRSILGRRSIG